MLINGSSADSIDARDRGLAYGDGLFETIRIAGGRPVLLSAHMERLRQGCELLGIVPPIDELEADIRMLLAGNALFDHVVDDAVIKVIVTRGVSGRGYKWEPETRPNRIVSVSEYVPDTDSASSGVSVMLCETRLGLNPRLAGVKHLNRLEQVMAAGEIPESFAEGLMMNSADELIEGTKTNLMLVERGHLVTPALTDCGVKGTMRAFLLDRMPSSIAPVSLARLAEADEVCVCNSVIGIWPVNTLSMPGGDTLTWPIGPVTRSLQKLIQRETGIIG